MFHRSTVFQREFEGAYDNKPCTEHFKTQGFCCTIWKERWLNQKSGVLLFLPLGTRFISELPTSQDKMGNCTLLTQNPGSMAIYWQKQIFWALNSKENYYVDPLIKVTKEHRGQWFDSWVCNMLTSESLSFCQYVDEMKKKKVQSWTTLCGPMDYTVHGTLQARILEWFAFPFFIGSSQPRDRTQVPGIGGRFFTSWATRETPICWQVVPKWASLIAQ